MGLPMAGHLLAAGYPVAIHSRTKSKAQSLIDAGAIWKDSPADASRDAQVIFVCVTDTPDVEKVVLGNSGVVESIQPGMIVVDHSTISPITTRQISQKLADKHAHFIDAPVSGGDIGAKNATLSIMCGGEKNAFDQVKPFLEKMGKTITYCGESGSGQITKLVNQVLVLNTLMAVCEGLNFAKSAGLDLQTTLAAIGAGAGKSWQLENLGAKIIQNDFNPGFMIDLAKKDMRLILEFAKQTSIPIPASKLVYELYNKLEASSGKLGTQALFHAYSSR